MTPPACVLSIQPSGSRSKNTKFLSVPHAAPRAAPRHRLSSASERSVRRPSALLRSPEGLRICLHSLRLSIQIPPLCLLPCLRAFRPVGVCGPIQTCAADSCREQLTPANLWPVAESRSACPVLPRHLPRFEALSIDSDQRFNHRIGITSARSSRPPIGFSSFPHHRTPLNPGKSKARQEIFLDNNRPRSLRPSLDSRRCCKSPGHVNTRRQSVRVSDRDEGRGSHPRFLANRPKVYYQSFTCPPFTPAETLFPHTRPPTRRGGRLGDERGSPTCRDRSRDKEKKVR